MKIKTEDCMACGQCMEYCPSEAINPIMTGRTNDTYLAMTIDQDLCVDCGECLNCDCLVAH